MRDDTYKSLSSQVYDIIYTDAPWSSIEFYLNQLQDSEEPVLEPMCGSGRYIIPFMERGIDIDGVDISRYMLQICRDRCEEKGLKPGLFRQSVEELNLPRKYGYLFIPEGSFSLIVSKEGALQSLNAFYRHLLPDGKLAIEIFTPKAHTDVQGKSSRDWFRLSETTVISVSRTVTYDAEKQIQRCVSKYEMVKDGHPAETEIETIDIRIYEIDQFRNLLDEAGFSSIEVENINHGNALYSEDVSIVFTCRTP